MLYRHKRAASVSRHSCKALALAVAIAACLPVYAVAAEAETSSETVVNFNIAAGDLGAALEKFSTQSGVQVLYRQELVAGKRARGVTGSLAPSDALERLLEGTGVALERANNRTFVLKEAGRGEPERTKPKPTQPRQVDRVEDTPVALPEVLVRGSSSLNADIRRSIDDPQPYVVFERETIERSGAMNINDFLLKRVSASSTSAPHSQTGEILGDRSGIDLRGLGEGQTLILIDGRRVANTSSGFDTGQPNLNGIPLAAVERIELLPTTASAIYGGSATGGVINIILRRDFQGGEVAISHDNSFDTDSSINRIDLTYGFNFNEGRTSVMLNGSHSRSNPLLSRDRDFYRRGVEHIARTDPGYLSNVFRLAALPNLLSLSGANLVLDDGTPLSASFTHVPAGYRGASSDGGAALVRNAGTWSTDPSPDGSWTGGASTIQGSIPRVESLGASVRHSFSDRLDAFLDVSHNQTHSWSSSGGYLHTNLAADDPRNPFQQDIAVLRSSGQLNGRDTMFNETDRASAGLIARLGDSWAGSLDFTWSRAALGYTRRPGVVDADAMLAGGFDPLDLTAPMDLSAFLLSDVAGYGLPVTSYTYNPTLRFSGPLWTLPAGPVTASFLLEQQNMKYGQGAQWNYPGSIYESMAIFPPRTQDVRSAYAEFTVPVFGKDNARAGLHALDLQLAVRRDSYDSVSGNFASWYPASGAPRPDFEMAENSMSESTYLIGLKYEPVPGLMFRASRGTGFVPPQVTQLGAATSYPDLIPWFPDPKRGNTVQSQPITYLTGSNQDLTPEYSRTTAFGVVIQPDAWPGFRLSLDYTRLKKTDNISRLSDAELLQFEELFPDRVRRGERLPSDPAGWAGPLEYIDTSLANAASAKYENLDLQIKYGFELANGAYLEFWGNGTWFLKAESQVLPTLPSLNLKGISAGYGSSIPLNFRGFFGVNVDKGNWGLGWSVRHYSSYLVANPELDSSSVKINAQGNGGRVPRQLYHDLSARWRSPGATGAKGGALQSFLANVEVSGGIRNVFDKRPPVDVSSDYFFYSYLGDVRMRTYYLQLKYAF